MGVCVEISSFSQVAFGPDLPKGGGHCLANYGLPSHWSHKQGQPRPEGHLAIAC